MNGISIERKLIKDIGISCKDNKMHTYNCIDISTNIIRFTRENNKQVNFMKNLLHTKFIYLIKKVISQNSFIFTHSKDSEI